MKSNVSLFSVFLFLFFSTSSEAIVSPVGKDDINADGVVDILDRLEWERGKMVGGFEEYLPSEAPEIPSPTDSVATGGLPASSNYNYAPIILIKSENRGLLSNLEGVVGVAPLINPKIQNLFLVRALDFVSKSRLATNDRFQNYLNSQLQRLREFASTLSDTEALPKYIIDETKNIVSELVIEGLGDRMFPEFFEDDVERIFKNIYEVTLWYKITFSSFSAVNKAMAVLGGESTRGVKFEFERNRLLKAAHNPNDTYFNPALRHFFTTLRDAWAWDNARFITAWDTFGGNQNIVTAILDTGFDLGHPDLRNRMWRNSTEVWNGVDDDLNGYVDDFQGWDFVLGSGSHAAGTWEDYNGHGTIMAGIIGSDSDNSRGIAGGSLQGQFMNLVVLDDNGYGQIANIDLGIGYAISMGADVVNLSFNGSVLSPSLDSLVQLASSLGMTVVGAAGNSHGEEGRFYSPVNIRDVISIGASTASLARSEFSNIAFGVDVLAPGGGANVSPYLLAIPLGLLPEFNIPSPMSQTIFTPPTWYSVLTLSDPLYWRVAGTSLSAAFTSSAASLIKGLRPSLTGGQIRQAIRFASLQRDGESGIVGEKGYGDLDVDGALQLAPMLDVGITSPGLYSPKYQSSIAVEGFVRNPGGLHIYQVELSYRALGDNTSHLISSLGAISTINYNWDVSALQDGSYYLELRARTSPSAPWSIDSMLIRKGPKWYEDVTDPSLPQVASYSLEGVDIDNDGDKDLVVANIGNAFAGLTPMLNNIFVNDGGGNFSDETSRFVNQVPEFTLKLIPADLNNDGFMDFIEIAFAITTPNDVFIWINEGRSNPGFFNRQILVGGTTFAEGGAVGDVNGDGSLDLFLATGWGKQDRLYLNNGQGFFTEETNRLPAELTFNAGSSMADFDSDGDLDIITGGWLAFYPASSARVRIYINNGSGFFTNKTFSWFTQNIFTWYDIEVGDLDSDGDLDVVCHNDYYLINNGSSFKAIRFNESSQISNKLLRNFEFGDIDRDGKIDLYILENIRSYILKNSGVDPLTRQIIWEDKSFEWLPTYRNVEVGVNDSDFTDWDGDGDLDILLGSNGYFFTENLRLYELKRSISGDVDGDGEITILDAMIIARYSAGYGSLTADQVSIADVDGNPGITIADALVIARIAAKLASSGISAVQGEFCSYCIGNPAF